MRVLHRTSASGQDGTPAPTAPQRPVRVLSPRFSIVIPLFINGLSNDFVGDCIDTYRPGIKRKKPIVIVFGEPVDFSEFYGQKPRAALYKRVADRARDAILVCAAREKALRAQIVDGIVPDESPGWLYNMERGK